MVPAQLLPSILLETCLLAESKSDFHDNSGSLAPGAFGPAAECFEFMTQQPPGMAFVGLDVAPVMATILVHHSLYSLYIRPHQNHSGKGHLEKFIMLTVV